MQIPQVILLQLMLKMLFKNYILLLEAVEQMLLSQLQEQLVGRMMIMFIVTHFSKVVIKLPME